MPVPETRATIGTIYCLLAPLAYTAYNLCLRGVSDKYDSAWITCVQASVGVAVFGVYLAWRAFQGRRVLPPWKELLALLAIGLITQVGGTLAVWAMSVVGAGTTATLQMGVMLAGSALLGLVVLRERVSWQQIVAIAMIVIAVVFFSKGARFPPRSPRLNPYRTASPLRPPIPSSRHARYRLMPGPPSASRSVSLPACCPALPLPCSSSACGRRSQVRRRPKRSSS